MSYPNPGVLTLRCLFCVRAGSKLSLSPASPPVYPYRFVSKDAKLFGAGSAPVRFSFVIHWLDRRPALRPT